MSEFRNEFDHFDPENGQDSGNGDSSKKREAWNPLGNFFNNLKNRLLGGDSTGREVTNDPIDRAVESINFDQPANFTHDPNVLPPSDEEEDFPLDPAVIESISSIVDRVMKNPDQVDEIFQQQELEQQVLKAALKKAHQEHPMDDYSPEDRFFAELGAIIDAFDKAGIPLLGRGHDWERQQKKSQQLRGFVSFLERVIDKYRPQLEKKVLVIVGDAIGDIKEMLDLVNPLFNKWEELRKAIVSTGYPSSRADANSQKWMGDAQTETLDDIKDILRLTGAKIDDQIKMLVHNVGDMQKYLRSGRHELADLDNGRIYQDEDFFEDENELTLEAIKEQLVEYLEKTKRMMTDKKIAKEGHILVTVYGAESINLIHQTIVKFDKELDATRDMYEYHLSRLTNKVLQQLTPEQVAHNPHIIVDVVKMLNTPGYDDELTRIVDGVMQVVNYLPKLTPDIVNQAISGFEVNRKAIVEGRYRYNKQELVAAIDEIISTLRQKTIS